MQQNPPDGYLARPGASTAPGVLVLHAWWGLNDTVKAFCDRLAGAGFLAFAPDLYHGQIATTIPQAEELSSALNGQYVEARAEVKASALYLSELVGPAAGHKLAVVGFSLGAYYALDLSTTDPEHIRSVVVFYGTGPEDFSGSQAEYLGHFAADDPYEPPENVDQLETLLKQAGRPATLHRYAGTGHWFFEPDRSDAYNEAAADLAWQRTLDFLKRTTA
jgi:carboxymethylenebutenolidase